VIAALADSQARSPRVVVADSKQLSAFRRVGLTGVKPNYVEAMQLLGVSDEGAPVSRAERLLRDEKRLLEITGTRIAAVTLDCEGAIVFERGRAPYRTYARPISRGCPSGAGDTFLAAFTLALAAGADTAAAGEIASAAAAVVVGKEGTAICSAAELRDCLSADGTPTGGRARLAVELAEHRRLGRRIVFTNGCFDILHRGHVTYLRRARELGDVLVVGVNSDASIRRLKGPTRPINTLEDRLAVLAALRFVDHLVPFDEDTPHELIRVVRPDVFVKGGDYTRDRLPEAALVEELGGVVRILPLVEDRSTTSLIDRIRGELFTKPPAAFPLLNGQATS
jgi:D-beta-D-heptose 7-phosphate kinase/D-beta-D-heptose 1-phosphate adenosyltransferase